MRPHHARGLAQSQMLPYFAVFTRKIAQNRSCSVVDGVRRARSSHASSIRVLSYVSPPPKKIVGRSLGRRLASRSPLTHRH